MHSNASPKKPRKPRGFLWERLQPRHEMRLPATTRPPKAQALTCRASHAGSNASSWPPAARSTRSSCLRTDWCCP
ncbi:hypothetical protein [Lysobacter gummosus]|uniref:hypothetical protein n=1 Tax=Lysobacter gummosus TaxID=262324 RepID=UPI003637853F